MKSYTIQKLPVKITFKIEQKQDENSQTITVPSLTSLFSSASTTSTMYWGFVANVSESNYYLLYTFAIKYTV